jgi:hypothetical protein
MKYSIESRPGGKRVDKLTKSARDRPTTGDERQLVPSLGLKPKGNQLQRASQCRIPADV